MSKRKRIAGTPSKASTPSPATTPAAAAKDTPVKQEHVEAAGTSGQPTTTTTASASATPTTPANGTTPPKPSTQEGAATAGGGGAKGGGKTDTTKSEREKEKEREKAAAKKRRLYQPEIQKMMYTFGDSRHPDTEASELLEDIVRQQIILLTRRAAAVAAERGTKLSAEDAIFQVRRDVSKYNRVHEFISWREVRKNYQKQQGEDDVGEEGDDAGLDSQKLPTPNQNANVKRKRHPSLDFPMCVLDLTDDDDSDGDDQSSSYLDKMEKERLHNADRLTRTMTKEQYMEYSDCRQASFTYKKAKKFREWIDFNSMDVKVDADMIDVLGYLAWEILGKIIQASKRVKGDMAANAVGEDLFDGTDDINNLTVPSPNKVVDDPEDASISVVHIREAFRRLQTPNPVYSPVEVGWLRGRGPPLL